jgi:Ca-activated chloride channel family protein
MNAGFDRPVLAVFAVAVPVVLVLTRRFWKSALTLSVSLGPPGGASFKPPFAAAFLRKLFSLFELASVSLLFLAAAGPVFISGKTVFLSRGADIIFVLDDSPSMAGLDMAPGNAATENTATHAAEHSRFEAARALIADFAEKRPADAVGLVACGNEAALLIPPTTDRNALLNRLGRLQLGEFGEGTALGMGLAVASLHLQKSAAPRKAVILITDGENNAGAVHPETAAAALAATGASFYVIGVGSGGVVPIDYVDPVSRLRRTGSFDSRFDAESLRILALAGKGTYIGAASAEAFATAFESIGEKERTIIRSTTRHEREAVHEPFLIAALGLAAAAFFCRRLVLGAFL